MRKMEQKWNKFRMTPRFPKHFASKLQKLVPNSSFSEEKMSVVRIVL